MGSIEKGEIQFAVLPGIAPDRAQADLECICDECDDGYRAVCRTRRVQRAYRRAYEARTSKSRDGRVEGASDKSRRSNR
jgi:hypothetical protein